MSHKFPYKWNIADGYPAKGIEKNNLNVFGTFICGGGSTMGYKLAGFNHLGGVEIDPQIADVYKENHNPKYLFLQDIRDFNKRTDLPIELYSLDLLDGSPPCSTFSMAGSREKAWNKEKVFREGQAKQTLDDLVFVYCDTIIKLQPKVFLLENVKGIIQGNAKVYSKAIVQKMTKAGYTVQVFCLNAASMGVPQKRERVFFIGHKNEFKLPKLKLEFNEPEIKFGEYRTTAGKDYSHTERGKLMGHRIKTDKCINDINQRLYNKNSGFNAMIWHDEEICSTITAGETNWRYFDGMACSDEDYILTGSFPLDYDFKTNSESGAKYMIGMSVPPVMTAQISHQIYLQWLSKIKNH